MKNEEILAIIEDCKKGNLSNNEAGKKIMLFIFLNKQYFNLASMNEDDFSDFLLWLYPTLCKLPAYYTKNRSTFLTYLGVVIFRSKLSWVRKTMKEVAARECLYSTLQEECTETYISEDEETYSSSDDEQIDCSLSPKELLILALKSSYYLTDRHIKILSQQTGHTADEIWKFKDELEKDLERKKRLVEQKRQALNHNYQLRNTSLWQLAYLKPNTTRYNQVRKSFIFQNMQWKQKNLDRQNNGIKTSNIQIAKVLQEKPGTIMNVMSKINRIISKE